ncbi:hypothetical protein NLI96_g3774 [Meripilus lineatus]|uniref:Uncharacterized protein n=1 Tax=Meripilus lineatus TaxID=2056292 RepID=A0AAD5V7P0_9APHY|nr:hypothetical protein NLI96_g3774 [Physisporinus lineatus]
MDEPEQGGEHDEDWISRTDNVERDDDEGSWDVSGMESQITRRLEDDPDEETATQTFDERAIDPTVNCDDEREPFDEGSCMKVDEPE